MSNPKDQTKGQLTQVEAAPDRALFQGKVPGLVAMFYLDERPLRGLAGLLDWRLYGFISQFLKSGAIRGEVGECVYLPYRRLTSPADTGVTTHHLVLLGGGHRSEIAGDAWATLKRNLISLGIPGMGLSKSDFGNPSLETLTKHLKGVPLAVLP